MVRILSIQAGDHAEHASGGRDSISVPDLARFFMNPQPEAAELDRLVRIPGLESFYLKPADGAPVAGYRASPLGL